MWWHFFSFHERIISRNILFARGYFLGVYKIHDELDHHLLLPRMRLSDEKCERDESTFIDLHLPISSESMTILLEKPDEEKCANSLVAISERMILDDEIEEMGSLFLDSRVEILAIGGYHARENAVEALIFLISEEGSSSSLFYELFPKFTNHSMCFIIFDDIGDIGASLNLETSRVILIEKDEALSIARDDFEESSGFDE